MSRAGRGFTLVEIMVAVGIFAVVSIAIYARIGEVVRQSQVLEERTLATWVAQNRLTAVTLEFRGTQEPVPLGRQTELVTLGGRTWQVTVAIQGTSDPGLRRVEIDVHPDVDGGTSEVAAAASVIGFVGFY